tara:strand:- start:4933 stop:5430 length:498 start_codon:yes stop_codon:yes gene_type:complete
VSWQTDWKVDKNVAIPDKKSNSGNIARNEFLQMLEIGDSFVVNPPKHNERMNPCSVIVASGKRLGMKLTSRKIYSEEDPKDFHYRIWYVEKIEPISRKKQKGDVPNYEVSHEAYSDLATGRLPNDILFLAEQNEENKAVVEDIRRLNKILIEELTKQNIKFPEGE